MSLPLRFGPYWLDAVLASGQSSLLVQARPAEASSTGEATERVVKIPYLFVQRANGYKQVFLDRAEVLSGVDHPSVVPVSDWARAGALVWCASPDIGGWDGAALIEAMHRDKLRPSARQVLTLGLHIADILESVHRHSAGGTPLVHGQLRPSKVLFLPDGDARLLLMSAVNVAGGERASAGSAERASWRAPELLLRQPESPRTDVRGLALLLFVFATGSNPFLRTSAISTSTAIQRDQVLFEDDSSIPADLSGLLRGAMASDPARRPETMVAFARSLRAVVNRLGGPEDWSPWVEALRARAPVSLEDRSSPDAESLINRIARDAPREGNVATEGARSPDETATLPVTTGSTSGFTLVPEDLSPEDRENALSQQARETTGEAPRRNSAAAAIFAAGGGADSSFVLVTEEDNITAGVVVGTPPSKRESLSDKPDLPTPLPEEDDDLLPAMSAEEGMEELAREQADQAQDDEVDPAEQTGDEDTEDVAHSAPPAEPLTASVRVQAAAPIASPPLPAQDLVSFVVSEPTEETEVADETEENEADGEDDELLFEPDSPTHESEDAPVVVTSEIVTAPRITAPTVPPPTPPAPPPAVPAPVLPPAPPAAPPTLARPAPAPTAPVAKPPTPQPPTPKPPAAQQSSNKGLTPILLALGIVLLIGVGVALSRRTNPNPPTQPTTSTAPPERAPDPPALPPTDPTLPAVSTDPGPMPPVAVETSPTEAAPVTPPREGTRVRNNPTSAAETTGAPGLVDLAVKVTPSRVVLVATFRGPVPKATTTLQEGVGPNGTDRIFFSFPDVESQMKITHRNVASTIVTGVEIITTPAAMELKVDAAPGVSIIPSVGATTATFTFIQPPPPQ